VRSSTRSPSLVPPTCGPRVATLSTAVPFTEADPLLTPEIRSAARVAAPYYAISFLRGQVQGKERLVVLMGEAHIKTQPAFEAGEWLRRHFDNYALERAGAANYDLVTRLASRVTMRALSIEREWLQLKSSTIDAAIADSEHHSNKHSYFIEKGHQPSREEKRAVVGMMLGELKNCIMLILSPGLIPLAGPPGTSRLVNYADSSSA
jgi:hypothetical protein